jgi:uncharacterized protein YqfB (UPF0267 family)
MPHELKTWPKYFDLLWTGRKTFEIRRDDCSFKEGDTLVLREWDPDTKKYTFREMLAVVTLCLRGDCIPEGYCAMQIRVFCFHYGLTPYRWR